MKKEIYQKFKKIVASIIVPLVIILFSIQNLKAEDIKIDHIKFVIGEPKGGGWDRKLQALGEVIKKLKLVKRVDYEYLFWEKPNGKDKILTFRAVYDFVKKANMYQDSMFILNNNLIIKYIQKISKYSFKDFTPIASIMYTNRIFQVLPNSKFKNLNDVFSSISKAFEDQKKGKKNGAKMPKIGGFGNVGSMSYLTFAKALSSAGVNPLAIDYYGFNGKFLKEALLEKKVDLIVPTLHSKAIKEHKEGKIKIIAIASEKDIKIGYNKFLPSVKQTYKLDASFESWFGLFSPPNLDTKRADAYAKIIEKALKSKEWKKIAKKNGWKTFFKPRGQFMDFLKKQDKVFKDIIRKVGSV